MKVTVTDGAVGVLPLPPRTAKKKPIRNFWELRIGKTPGKLLIPSPIFLNHFELIREVSANTGYFTESGLVGNLRTPGGGGSPRRDFAIVQDPERSVHNSS